MDLIFSDLYDRESQELRISREATMNALNNPDKTQEERYDDLVLRLFLKKENQRDSYLLVLTQIKDNKLHPLLPFRILQDFFPNIEVLEPLMILELLAHRHGLVIGIGRRLGRFVYQEDIPLREGKGEIIQIRNPDSHPFIQSTFVKIIKTPSGYVAKCALAFCIDKTTYRSWLSSKPQKEIEFKVTALSITRIIPLESVRQIIKDAMREKDTKKRFNIIELGLALQIIRRVMGNDWYQKVLRQFQPGTKISNIEYRCLVKSDNVHPLSEILWSGRPENYIRVVSLALYFNQLWREDDSNNLSEKIKELRQYSFAHTYYELKISAFFDRRGFPVTFIKREKDLQTPDFRINSRMGFAFGECKRKDVPSLQINGDVEKAALQIESYGGPGIIFIEVLPKINDKSAKDILDRASLLLAERKKVSLFILTNEEQRNEFDMCVLGTNVWGIENSNAQSRLPETIKKAAFFQDPIAWLPLSQTLPKE